MTELSNFNESEKRNHVSYTSTWQSHPALLGALEAGLVCRDGFLADGRPLGVGRGHLVLLSQGGVDHLGTGDGELSKEKGVAI